MSLDLHNTTDWQAIGEEGLADRVMGVLCRLCQRCQEFELN